MTEALLEVRDLRARYGQTVVLSGIDLDVRRGEVVTLLGLNGAGKTTLLRCIAGLKRSSGAVRYDGRDATRWTGARRHRSGLAYVPQTEGVFPGISVGDHLRLARQFRDERLAIQDELLEWFPVLKERFGQDAQTLSGGQRKMLSVVMALSSEPSLVLLDEPTEGVAPVVREQLVEALAKVTARAAVILVEQNLGTAVAIGGRCHVVERGTIVESGQIADLVADGTIERRLTV